MARINDIKNGTWCPCKKNKTEQKLYEFLNFIFGEDKIDRNIILDGCKNITFLRFDFRIEKYKIIVELDGLQHFVHILSIHKKLCCIGHPTGGGAPLTADTDMRQKAL